MELSEEILQNNTERTQKRECIERKLGQKMDANRNCQER